MFERRGEHPSDHIDEGLKQADRTCTTEEEATKTQPSPAQLSHAASRLVSEHRHGFCSTVCRWLFEVRRWLVRECHMMDVEILKYLISSHQHKQLPQMPWLGVACHKMQPQIGEPLTAGGVRATHAIRTSSSCTPGPDGPWLRFPVTLAVSPSCSSPVPAMDRRQFAAVNAADKQ